MFVSGVKAQSATAIYINSDGSVTGTSMIQRDGDIYRLTGNTYDSPITVLRNNIVLDGEGFSLQGSGGWGIAGVAGVEVKAAINLTCGDVIVRNFNISGWETGILGAYNGNTIINNNITGTQNALAIYADNYNVTGNYLASNIYGVLIKGNTICISNNQIQNNVDGILIFASSRNVITENYIANNDVALNMYTMPPTDVQIYDNNFINKPDATIVSTTSDQFSFGNGGTMPPLDNGTVGNYWSDYTTKYPNATEIENTNIGNTPYLIRVNPTVIDRFPLMAPVNIQKTTLASPSQTPTPSPNPSNFTVQSILITALIIAFATCIAVLVFRKKLL